MRFARGVAALAVLIALASGCNEEADRAPVTAPLRGPAPAEVTPGTIGRRGVTYITDCQGDPRHGPSEIIITCADSNYGVGLLRWRGWGTQRAVASGVAVVNNCIPDCTRGAFAQYPVTVVLTHIRDGEAAAFYTRMAILAPDAPGAGMPEKDLYRLGTPAGGRPGPTPLAAATTPTRP